MKQSSPPLGRSSLPFLRHPQMSQTLIELPMVAEKFERTLKDEQEKKYMRAAANGAETPKDFAEALGITPEEAEKIRKRLKYRAQAMRDMW